jgi:hypothetical protein
MNAEFDNELTPKQITQISANDNSYVLPINECDHLIGYRHSQRDAFLIDLDDDLEPNTFFIYCPMCGVKL